MSKKHGVVVFEYDMNLQCQPAQFSIIELLLMASYLTENRVIDMWAL